VRNALLHRGDVNQDDTIEISVFNRVFSFHVASVEAGRHVLTDGTAPCRTAPETKVILIPAESSAGGPAMDDIGGLDGAVKILHETISLALDDPASFLRFGLPGHTHSPTLTPMLQGLTHRREFSYWAHQGQGSQCSHARLDMPSEHGYLS